MHHLNMTQLSRIRPGDAVRYVTKFLGVREIHVGIVKFAACRSGFDSDGYLNSDDDYLIVETTFDPTVGPEENEVNYSDVLEIL